MASRVEGQPSSGLADGEKKSSFKGSLRAGQLSKPLITPKPFSLQRNTALRSINAPKTAVPSSPSRVSVKNLFPGATKLEPSAVPQSSPAITDAKPTRESSVLKGKREEGSVSRPSDTSDSASVPKASVLQMLRPIERKTSPVSSPAEEPLKITKDDKTAPPSVPAKEQVIISGEITVKDEKKVPDTTSAVATSDPTEPKTHPVVDQPAPRDTTPPDTMPKSAVTLRRPKASTGVLELKDEANAKNPLSPTSQDQPSKRSLVRNRLSMELTMKFESGGQPLPSLPPQTTRGKYVGKLPTSAVEPEKMNPTVVQPSSEKDAEVLKVEAEEDRTGGSSIKRRITLLFDPSSRPEVATKREEPPVVTQSNETGAAVKDRIKNWALETNADTDNIVQPQTKTPTKDFETIDPPKKENTPSEMSTETADLLPAVSSAAKPLDDPVETPHSTSPDEETPESSTDKSLEPVQDGVSDSAAVLSDPSSLEAHRANPLKDRTLRRSVRFGTVERDDGKPPVLLGSEPESSAEEEDLSEDEGHDGPAEEAIKIEKEKEREKHEEFMWQKQREEQKEKVTRMEERLRENETFEEAERQKQRQREEEEEAKRERLMQKERELEEDRKRVRQDEERLREEMRKKEKQLEEERLRKEEKERESQREEERERQKIEERLRAEERERERQREEEREKQRVKERLQAEERERERQREEEREKQRVKERLQAEERERERQREEDREKQRVKERLQAEERERERQREEEREKQRVKERLQAEERESERQREEEREKQRVKERLQVEERERERQREEEREKQRVKERLQAEERESERQREEEREKQRVKERLQAEERERERQREEEREKQRVEERLQAEERERERQREEERLKEEEREKQRDGERLKEEAKERQTLEERLKVEERERARLEERLREEAKERQRVEERLREEAKERLRLEERLREQERERQKMEERLREEERVQERLKKEEMERERQVELMQQQKRDEDRERARQMEERLREEERVREEARRREVEETERLEDRLRAEQIEREAERILAVKRERDRLIVEAEERERERQKQQRLQEEQERERQTQEALDRKRAEEQEVKLRETERRREEEERERGREREREREKERERLQEEQERIKKQQEEEERAQERKEEAARRKQAEEEEVTRQQAVRDRERPAVDTAILISFDSEDVGQESELRSAVPAALLVEPTLRAEDPLEVPFDDFSVKKSVTEVLFDDFSVTPRRWGSKSRVPQTPEPDSLLEDVWVRRAPDVDSRPHQAPQLDQLKELDVVPRPLIPCLIPQPQEEPRRPYEIPTVQQKEAEVVEEDEDEEVHEEKKEEREGGVAELKEKGNSFSAKGDGLDTEALLNNEPQQQYEDHEHNDVSESEAESPTPALEPHLDVHLDESDGAEPRTEPELPAFPESSAPLLDNKALRSRAELRKRMSQRTRLPRTRQSSPGVFLNEDSASTPDWRVSDNTEETAESNEDEKEKRSVKGPPTAQRSPVFPGLESSHSALVAQLKKKTGGGGGGGGVETTPVKDKAAAAREELAALSPSPSMRSRRSAALLPGAARVLPPIGGKDDGTGSSPSWMQELKKKRMSQQESGT